MDDKKAEQQEKRIQTALNSTTLAFKLVDQDRLGAVFTVYSNGKRYETCIAFVGTDRCNCPDAVFRGNLVCKHKCFILMRHFQLPRTSKRLHTGWGDLYA
jgi:hypothetical protein